MMLEALGYLSSVAMGAVLGLTGGGGSILTVPILVYLFGVEPVLATGYSLFIVGATAAFGGLDSWRRGLTDLRTGALFAVPSFVGVSIARAWIVPALPDPVAVFAGVTISKPALIMVAFAALMILASSSMIRGRRAEVAGADGSSFRHVRIGAQGFGVGIVTGFVGAGGGFLIIPALVVLVGLPMRVAVGTSLLVIAANSLIGFTSGLWRQETIDWRLLLGMTALAICGMVPGLAFAGKIPERTLKKIFGYFVLIVGALVLADQFRKF